MQEKKLLENVVFMRLKERCFLKTPSCGEQDLSGASFAGGLALLPVLPGFKMLIL